MITWWRRRLAAAIALSVLWGLCATTSVLGGELSLLLNGKAFHLDEPDGVNWNEENWGGGLQYDFTDGNEKWIPFLNASAFLDSVDNMSYYAGGGIVRRYAPLSPSLRLDLGAVAFLMTREDYKKGRPFFGALPVVSIGTERVAVNVTYVPKVHPKMSALFFLQLKVTIAH